MDAGRLAPVYDLAAARERRLEARRKILQAANRVRLSRTRYVSSNVRCRETVAPKLLTMRHIQQAVSIVRHWGVVDAGTLRDAGFKSRDSRVVNTETRKAA